MNPNKQDLRLPRVASPPPSVTDLYSPRIPLPPIFNQKGLAPIIQIKNTALLKNNCLHQKRASKNNTEVLKLEVQHGSDRHSLILRGQNKNLTVLDLQNELEKITSVPIKDQRLYFKSLELSLSPFKTLKGIYNQSIFL